MASWDDAKPHGNIPVSQLDNESRDQFQFIKAWADIGHIFPGSVPGDGGIHREGSARGWYEVESNLASKSNGLATSTGMVFYASDTDKLYFCSDGANDDWVEVQAIGGTLALNDLSVAGNVTGAANFSGLLTASGSILVPAGETIQGIEAEDWFGNAGDLYDPTQHASRHGPTGLDSIKNVIQQVQLDYDESSTVSDSDKLLASVSVTVADANTTVLVIASCATIKVGGAAPAGMRWVLNKDGTPLGGAAGEFTAFFSLNGGSSSGQIMYLDTAVAAGTYVYELRCDEALSPEQGTYAEQNMGNRLIAAIDLGAQ